MYSVLRSPYDSEAFAADVEHRKRGGLVGFLFPGIMAGEPLGAKQRIMEPISLWIHWKNRKRES